LKGKIGGTCGGLDVGDQEDTDGFVFETGLLAPFAVGLDERIEVHYFARHEVGESRTLTMHLLPVDLDLDFDPVLERLDGTGARGVTPPAHPAGIRSEALSAELGGGLVAAYQGKGGSATDNFFEELHHLLPVPVFGREPLLLEERTVESIGFAALVVPVALRLVEALGREEKFPVAADQGDFPVPDLAALLHLHEVEVVVVRPGAGDSCPALVNHHLLLEEMATIGLGERPLLGGNVPFQDDFLLFVPRVHEDAEDEGSLFHDGLDGELAFAELADVAIFEHLHLDLARTDVLSAAVQKPQLDVNSGDGFLVHGSSPFFKKSRKSNLPENFGNIPAFRRDNRPFPLFFALFYVYI